MATTSSKRTVVIVGGGLTALVSRQLPVGTDILCLSAAATIAQRRAKDPEPARRAALDVNRG
jgi:hypothetical protein